MSRLQNAVQQLKSKNQPILNNADRSLGLLSLSEATLSQKELNPGKKVSKKGDNKGKEKYVVFADKIANGEEHILKDGKTTKIITKIKLGEKEYSSTKMDDFKTDYAKSEKPKLSIFSPTGLKLSDLLKTPEYGGASAGKGPSGAEWEHVITYHYNKLNNKEDKESLKVAEKFFNTDYDEQGKILAKKFKEELRDTSLMTQFGGGKSKSNLSSFWQQWGATDGTPKTDMYTKNYYISLKKKGGSQLASAAKGETLANFYAALEYMAVDRNSNKDISNIMTEIENNFMKLSTEMTKGQLEEISQDPKQTKELDKKDKAALTQFVTTEKFHKELNKTLKKTLSVENNPEFRKWYVFEALSGNKKFKKETIPIASQAIEFNPDNGTLSKNIPITEKGKKGGKPSSDVVSISEKVKFYVAWKSASGNPYSSFRVGMNSYIPSGDSLLVNEYIPTKEEMPTIQSVFRETLMNDEITRTMYKTLTEEEFQQLDEFRMIGKVFNKIKDIGKKVGQSVKAWFNKAFLWLKNMLVKLKKNLQKALNKIAATGEKIFQGIFNFLGIEATSVKPGLPADVVGFVNK